MPYIFHYVKPQRKQTGDDKVKTTVELPEALWRAAKIRGVEQHTDLRAVIIDALELLLRTKAK